VLGIMLNAENLEHVQCYVPSECMLVFAIFDLHFVGNVCGRRRWKRI